MVLTFVMAILCIYIYIIYIMHFYHIHASLPPASPPFIFGNPLNFIRVAYRSLDLTNWPHH